MNYRKEVVDLLGGRCVSPDCKWINADGSIGCTDARCLQIDHINGGGVRLLRRGSHYREMFLDAHRSTRYQLLCANCNWIKRHIKGEHPGRPRLGENPKNAFPYHIPHVQPVQILIDGVVADEFVWRSDENITLRPKRYTLFDRR